MDKKIISMEEAKKSSIDSLIGDLSTSRDGLSSSEVKDRLEVYGPNEIVEKKANPIIKFLRNFWGPIPWMIEAAAILSLIIQHWEDFVIISLLLLINAGVKFFQENKADNAIELLKKKLALKARVKRDGKWVDTSASDLVPGDVIRIRLGDVIPADVKLIEGDYLQADESALTGESLPVEKHASDVGYSGSVVRQGEMDTVVVATGVNTYFGKTAMLAEEISAKSHFQKAVVKIGNYLIVVTLMLVLIIITVELLRHHDFLTIIQFALVLTIAGIPVALPAVLSITMAVGAVALSKKEAIVSKLVAIEEMAGINILCADKTGTITKNEIKVAELSPIGKFSKNDVIVYATLASREEDKDPIDTSIIEKSRADKEALSRISNYKIVSFKPFDPVIKRTEAEIEDKEGGKFKVSKGAPQVILKMASENAADAGKINKIVDDFASAGYRALGVARSDEDGKWDFVGLLSLHDPPRDDSADTIKTAQSMGVEVKMVTGDHTAIAKEIAGKVNLGTDIQPASSFIDVPDDKAGTIVENADGFAQVFPEHKYRIVKLLQDKGHIVAMTGDGVNDVPALKKADAGIAVAGATDAAKSAADIVLTSPGLSVIIDAIKESRKIFQRMTNYSIYRMGETIRLVFFITASIIIFNFYPITPLMIILLALLNDTPIMTIAYDNVHFSDKPEKWNMRTLLGISTFLGLFGVLWSFGILIIGIEVFHLSHALIQSFIYLKLSVAGQLFLFVARTRSYFWTVKPAPILLLAACTSQTIATLITVYGIFFPAAMGWKLAIFVWGYAILSFLVTDLLKVQIYKFLDRGTIPSLKL
ncbi:plasma-membrane proton-efflux P-type ATPase [Methanocella sp. CWC-04]|uniref:Plasma-membrane proton-efflux P-type ATPase n=1 Tax=Methanooceanicella nereidis TaxID=2052831 RepID=A0AAP2W7D6_9EURY|nr:plasma-membrane proton-efflux P-type ATPase [Methanocella sp. CWC-04]MCD1295094.1 plasma-membrane proton-efflux P-type ATPase [Methanocella sp. CWC-04]